jgi:hypothetical protein
MRQRCDNPNSSGYHNYGGRDITLGTFSTPEEASAAYLSAKTAIRARLAKSPAAVALLPQGDGDAFRFF